MADRGTHCPNSLHDYPLPRSYIAASDEADERLAAKWHNVKCPDCGLYGWKPPAAKVNERTCRYCGRTGQKQFTQMHDGLWRCKSPDYCQRRARRQRREVP